MEEELIALQRAYDEVCAERDALQAQLDKIEAQRKKWRENKKKSRKVARNPQRYNSDQVSIYGEGHVQELTS